MRQDVDPGSAENWFMHAKSDLRLAELGHIEGVLYNQLCFHAQQCVEKAIKAVLIYKKIEFPPTHNIRVLLNLVAEKEIPDKIISAALLTEYAVESRYPSDVEEITDEEYQQAIELAQIVLKWCLEICEQA
jgi:HEPN domain-containing protein